MHYNCSLCSKTFFTIEILVCHLKYIHFINSNTILKCGQENCPQHFDKISCFKRHMKACHKNLALKDIVPKKTPNLPQHNPTSPNLVTRNFQNQFFEKETNLNFEIGSNLNFEIGLNEETNLNFEIGLNEGFKNVVENLALSFVCKLCSKSNIPTSLVENILEDITFDLFDPIFTKLKKIILPLIPEKKDIVSQIIDSLKTPFNSINTEHLLLKKLKEKDLYEHVNTFIINRETKMSMTKGQPHLKDVKSVGTILPIEFQIKKFFEQPNVLTDVLNYMQILSSSKSSNISNFIQGELWQKKLKLINKEYVIPFFLYYDDFETGDPLGSNSGKQSLAGFYFNFPTIPKKYSSLETIFVAMILKSKDLKAFGSSKSCYMLINVIKKLESEGILIKTDGKTFHVHFALGLVIGDNLGVNSILGFAKSFSHNFYCRICIKKKEENNIKRADGSSFLRTIENYENSLKNLSYKETGIFENSIFNTIPSFHVTENFSADIMHDCMEGVIKYGIIKSLEYFINAKKMFTLDYLNSRIQNFDYGDLEIPNRPPIIKEQHFKSNSLHLNARQSFCFLNYFSCFLGDKIPKLDKVWSYVLILQEMVEMCLETSYTCNKILLLSNIIHKHNTMYIKTFGDTLKPKHHFLYHYPLIIKKSGPLRMMWCMRFESKHREMKNYTNVTTSRVNLALSLGKKCMIKVAYNNLKNFGLGSDIGLVKKPTLTKKTQIEKDFNIKLPDIVKENILEVLSFEFKGSPYTKNYYCYNFENKELLKIITILVEDQTVFLIFRSVEIKKFDKHFRVFVVGKCLDSFKCTNLSESSVDSVLTKCFQLHTIPDGRTIFKPRIL